MEDTDIKSAVRDKYARAALSVTRGAQGSCCTRASGEAQCCDPITGNLYDAGQVGELPQTAVLASLGCGNPTALAELKPGEIVLDLGSGGGIDVLLSARRVAPSGSGPSMRAYPGGAPRISTRAPGGIRIFCATVLAAMRISS